MPKVVIGEGIHGYRLGRAALVALRDATDCGHIERRPIDADEDPDDPWNAARFADGEILDDGHDYPEDGTWAARACPALVRVVARLGEAAAHPVYAGRLGVVEVPDGVAWYIERDGETSHECVAECHRTWCLPEKPA